MLVSYHDANMRNNAVTVRSVTWVLNFINKIPIDWHANKQAAAEKITYDSDSFSARTFVEQILDLRITLSQLGVTIQLLNFMFDDKKGVVDSSMPPNEKIYKCHVAL